MNLNNELSGLVWKSLNRSEVPFDLKHSVSMIDNAGFWLVYPAQLFVYALSK